MGTQPPIDVRDMAIVHRTFREGYTEAARLVRAAAEPSRARVEFLADHVDFSIKMLHIHHEGEDELLYPKLIERLPEQAPMTEDVEHEHQLIVTALDAAAAKCAAWRDTPSGDTATDLATSLDALNAELQRHLDDEENKIVPLAATSLTQDEWDEIGEHAVAKIPAKQRPIAFGMTLDPLDADERAYMKRTLPAPVRLLYPLLIERPWKKYAATLRNGA